MKKKDFTKEIVKVQISLFSSEPTAQVLVYNESRSHLYEGDAPAEIVELMDGEPKKFFWANMPKEKGFIELLKEAPWQDW
jgi:hypothetical protein